MLIEQKPARMENLYELMAFISGCAEKKGFTKDVISRIELVVEEALVNVFLHAYAEKEGQVEVRCAESDNAALVIEIRDTGIFFDPLALAQPDLSSNIAERKIGGMGVFFIRKMTDKLKYYHEGDTNVLSLTFFHKQEAAQ